MKQAEKSRITKERIIKAAMNEFAEYGYSDSSLNNICKTGISKGLLYHNFANKDAIYLACVKQICHEFMTYLIESNQDVTPHAYMQSRLRYFKNNKIYGSIFFDSIIKAPKHLYKELSEVRKELDDCNIMLYLKMIKKIKLRVGVSEEDATKYFVLQYRMFNGYITNSSYYELSHDELIEIHENSLSKIIDYMLYGIAERKQ